MVGRYQQPNQVTSANSGLLKLHTAIVSMSLVIFLVITQKMPGTYVETLSLGHIINLGVLLCILLLDGNTVIYRHVVSTNTALIVMWKTSKRSAEFLSYFTYKFKLCNTVVTWYK